jgi:hypothetical protein
MSRNASGVYSLPLSPVVTGTTIASSWANTTLADIAAEMTDSLDRSGKGAMLAPMLLTNGAYTSPSLAFATEISTGLYRVDAGRLGFATLGSPVFYLTTGQSAHPALQALSWQGAAGAQDDFQFITNNTRTNGNLFTIINNATTEFALDVAGNLTINGYMVNTLKVGATGAGTLLGGVLSSQTLANSSLTLKGNRSAADAGTDVLVDTMATRSTGYLFGINNNGTAKVAVQPSGAVLAPNTMQVFELTSTLNNNTTTYSNVTGMAFSVAANADYFAEFDLLAQTTGASTLYLTCTGPASPTALRISAICYGGTPGEGAVSNFGGDVVSLINLAAMASVTVRVYLRNGANAGTVQLQFKSSSAGQQVTIYLSSIMRWQRVDNAGMV